MKTRPWQRSKILATFWLRQRMRRLRAKESQIQARLNSIPPFVLVGRTVRELRDDDATHMAAGVAFYAILSLFPMTLGLVALLSVVLDSTDVQAQLMAFFLTYLPGATDTLNTNADAVGSVRSFLGVFSVLGLFWTASAVFGAISRAVNRAWDVHRDRPFWLAKLRHIAMAVGVGLLFLLSVGTTALLQFLSQIDLAGIGRIEFLIGEGTSIIARLVPFVFTLAIFLLIYKYIPNTKTHWRYIWPGVLLAGIAFEVSKSGFVLYLDHFADYEKVYGSLGSVVALLVWIYFSAFILIAGAELSSEYGRMREGVNRGRLIEHRNRDVEAV